MVEDYNEQLLAQQEEERQKALKAEEEWEARRIQEAARKAKEAMNEAREPKPFITAEDLSFLNGPKDDNKG